MDKKDLFFEIEELAVSDDLKANLIMVENNGEGQAYLGWCETLIIDTPVTTGTDTEPSVLILPFAVVGLLSCQGTPIPAPPDWQNHVARPLDIQENLMVMIEAEVELEINATVNA